MEGIIGGIVDITMWWDVKNKEEAYSKNKHIDLNNVMYLSFDENMFSTLPTLHLEMIDGGGYITDEPLTIGRELFVELQSKAKDDIMKNTSPLLIASKIESFKAKPNMFSGKTTYVIECVLNATSFVNKVITYPQKTIADILGLAENSADVIKNVAGLGGIPVACDISPSDRMHWINNNLTCKDFVDKVVNHSWISADDASIFYVTLDGWGHYTSIKTLCKNQSEKNIVTQSKVDYKISTDGIDKTYSSYLLPNSHIVAGDFRLINTGSRTQNVGGGIHQAIFYDNNDGNVSQAILNEFSGKASAPDSQNVGFYERPNVRYVKFDGHSDQVFMGGQSNNDSQVARSVREKKFAGIHFDTTHIHYDIAESNNKAIKIGFFQQFWKIAIDCSKQYDYFYTDDEMMPKIGDVCNIDMGRNDSDNPIYSGRYLITRVEHVWSKNNNYNIFITVCADGLHLSNQKCPHYDLCPNANKCRFTQQFENCPFYSKQAETAAVEDAIKENEETAEIIEMSNYANDESSTNNISQTIINKNKETKKASDKINKKSTATTKKSKPKKNNPTTTQKQPNCAERLSDLEKENEELKSKLARQQNPWAVWTPDI